MSSGPYTLDPQTGFLHPVRHCPSPNHGPRPPGCAVDLLVIHAISLPPGEFGGGWIDCLFTNRLDPQAHPAFAPIADLRVSAHLLIDRGGAVTQYVPFHRRAWHAGRSAFGGRTECNDFSVGIELEGDEQTPYPEPQYTSLIQVVRTLRRHYPKITPSRIVGHSDIAPDRKTDPGPAFDWPRLLEAL
ncbi:1,6-anhydro-N-acetylmuramyl-L-alanine amidase AmpD [Halorhodospira halophila]|uniref:1,6-anhydro-N-acetylmuramyl-L-alanine amidase AmpD n=1 Tax=Halorhodospira halophila (strain DSM 244 / SL1) TaxID=349124 RepID=A1WWA9_HALHL|nr:1,6-anhydro-N-acetylmuramyl-L-alanine amidase AmpD [Halorhodospira halophila]ABM61971.1 N-acetylmuramoyl-L-alanine amidase, family 2 [Halorhodospira halophila SL1]MBK1729701.1 1,6-anhydro-N-acetylmuramyl-L-alanine amidase AmpD [Halorhodospira halophila]